MPPDTTKTVASPGRLLITAGPTQEPIDAVRFIGNRSSGRLGVALADHAASLGWNVRLLLGPTCLSNSDSRVELIRFRTTADLQAALEHHLPSCDVLVMAAAVADYRPRITDQMLQGKHRRKAEGMSIELEATPDLLAGCAARRSEGQTLVGFALEPRDQMIASARAKLTRKSLDLIVANPLETMDDACIEAIVLTSRGHEHRTAGAIPKTAFAPWLMGVIAEYRHAKT
ncbi:MAG: phosphopantothenoylcysteine decarboxylase [Phycisphaeraceae bacterium]|nr:phosphopantothenoylcysteine decarboxylase [Phycisphaeraceae bacterium]